MALAGCLVIPDTVCCLLEWLPEEEENVDFAPSNFQPRCPPAKASLSCQKKFRISPPPLSLSRAQGIDV